MNVRTKLLISQSLNVAIILAVTVVAVVIAQRYDRQLARAQLAYEQRQTKTMLAVQAFHYKTVIGDVLDGRGRPGDIEPARREVHDTLAQLVARIEQKSAFLDEARNRRYFEESERAGMLEASFAAIDSLVDRTLDLRRSGSEEAARQLHQEVEQRFAGEVAELLAAAMADEHQEVAEADARIDALADRRVAFLVAAGLCALASSLATGLALYRSISRPILNLLAGVRAVKAGALDHRVESRGDDELAQLASQFNAMAETLQDRERRLLEAQSGLERQVAERTLDLEAANRRLQHLDRQRLLFLAEVSHELRTPVTILRGEADVTLRAEPASAAVYRDTLARISQQAEEMGRLIDDLLFLVRTEADTIPFDMQRIDLQGVVADAARDGAVLARGKGIAIREHLPGRAVWANADAQRLRQAMLIAIDNAVRHSGAGSAIEVSLAVADGRAAIAVADRGAGVPAEELPYVFERFYRIRGGAKRRPHGSGLGLPIAKWIAEKHGGTIALESTPGEATRLTIGLPLADGGGA